jgi:FkbM family methyltransferase
MRARLSQIFRQNDVVRAILDHFPVDIRQADGSVVPGSRRTSRIFRIWQEEALHKESRQAFEAYEGGDLLDVGAFHGWYALLLAPRARSGDAFVELEPDGRAYAELLANLEAIARWYPTLRLHALPTAIGNGKPMRIEWPMGPDGHPSFSSSNDASGIPTTTVDAICQTLKVKPAFIKIDVEGAEAFVLEGMDETLDSHAPTVMLEIHPKWQPAGHSVDGLIERLKRHGYSGRDLAEQPLARRMLWSKRA